MRKKITIIGAGKTGVTTAFLLAKMNLADIVLISRDENKAKGLSLDILQAAAIFNKDVKIIGSSNYENCRDSDIVIITAGVARKKGMSRDDLVYVNREIIKEITRKIKKYAPHCIIIVLTNPVDIMTYIALKESGFSRNRVMGQSGILDTARYRTFIAQELGVSVKDVSGMVLGGHGDAMLPLIRYTNVQGIPIEFLLSEDKIEEIVDRTRYGGGEIVSLVGESAYYAPSYSIIDMVSSIINNEKRTLPVVSYLDGEYGYENVCVGVPVILSNLGIEKIIELSLTNEEKIAFNNSVHPIIELINKL